MKRRNLLKAGIFFGLGASLSWPLYAFIEKKRYRPPLKRRITRKLEKGDIIIEPEFVLFETSSGPIAISRTCTHLGCRVNYLKDKKLFLCPCHQSKFSNTGKYISGPAKKDLFHFPVKPLENGKGVVVFMPR